MDMARGKTKTLFLVILKNDSNAKNRNDDDHDIRFY